MFLYGTCPVMRCIRALPLHVVKEGEDLQAVNVKCELNRCSRAPQRVTGLTLGCYIVITQQALRGSQALSGFI